MRRVKNMDKKVISLFRLSGGLRTLMSEEVFPQGFLEILECRFLV